MKVAYFDCFSGISGDMILGAFIDAGFDLEELKSELKKLKISGYKVESKSTMRNAISGTKVNVQVTEQTAERHLNDIVEIIEKSDLSDSIKERGKEIFRNLAEAEAKIHHKDIREIHFHEVGALDSIVDIIGSLICLEGLSIQAVYSSEIHVGRGFLECQHGTLPTPAPATTELLKNIPIYSKGVESELTTPTGAAILKTISKGFGDIPKMKVKKIGYGAGSRELEIPNLLRVYIGEMNDCEYEEDNVILIETNIDDMNPEFFDYVSEMLLKKGSLDVFMTPIFMKKNRPGIMLGVLTREDKLDEILSTIFTETTTLGVRIRRLERKKLVREIVSVETRFGKIRVKMSKIGGQIKNTVPEYEDCKEIAVKLGIPLKDIYDEVRRTAQETLFDEKRAT